MDQIGLNLIKSNLLKLDQNESKWIYVVQNESNWFKLDLNDQTCSNLIRLDEIGSN